VQGTKYGSINVKSSLALIDAELETFRMIIILAAIIESIVIVIGLGILLRHYFFKPLQDLTESMDSVAAGDLRKELKTARRNDEIGTLSRSFNSMSRQLGQARDQLHKYLNPHAIEEAYRRAKSPTAPSLAEEKEITVLFVDIVAFTTTSERLGASGTVAYLNRYFNLVTGALIDFGGHIDKFVADEIVCVFQNNNHADNAVKAAKEILRLLNSNALEDTIQVRIGINTGTCIVADIGSERAGRLDRTVIGDTVNIAQRLMTRGSPNTAVLSEHTYSSLHSKEGITSLGELKLKGKNTVVNAYHLH